jgi:hypothetical protein
MTFVTGIPGLIALLICLRRGPERALLDVYIPALLLLPSSYEWIYIGHLSFNDTAIIPIAGFIMARSWRDWPWSFTDLLVVAYVALSLTSEYINKNFAEARNETVELACSTIFPYIVAKGIFLREGQFRDAAKTVVVCLTIVAIVNVYEFRMGRNPFDTVLSPLFPGQSSAGWIGRYGFLRTAGPFAHAILAGVMFAVGYRLLRWLEFEGCWLDRLRPLPISKLRFCKIALIAGSAMTLSRGPWLGAAVGALVVYLGRVPRRRETITIVALGILLVGIPLFQAGKSYVWVERSQATSAMEETAAYRHELIEKYMDIVHERPLWGWGRHNFPIVGGMPSVDNQYLLLALTHGEYALTGFVLILAWMITRLIVFCVPRHGSVFPGSLALTFLGIYVIVIVSVATVWLGAQTEQMLFLITGWSEGLILTLHFRSATEAEPARPVAKKLSYRIMV